MCVIPVLERQKLEDHNSEVNLSYIYQRKRGKVGRREGGRNEGGREGI